MPDLTKVTFYLSNEDRQYLATIRDRHPNWSTAMIFKRALGLYASNLEKLEPHPQQPKTQARQAIEKLFGPG